MASTEEAILEIDTIEELSDGIKAEVEDVFAAAQYSSGWVSQDFLYEEPVLRLSLDSMFGEFHLQTAFTNISDNGLYRLLNSANAISDISSIDASELVGETVFVCPDDEQSKATVYTSRGPGHNSEEEFILYSSPNETPFESSSLVYEQRSVEWLNKELSVDCYRQSHGTHGWMPVTLNYTAEKPYSVRATPETPEIKYAMEWSFEQTVDGAYDIHNFLSQLNCEESPTRISNCRFWAKPVRDIHHTNRPVNELLLSDDEKWILSEIPLTPTEETSWWESFKSKFSFGHSSGLDVSVSNGRPRKAKASDEYSEDEYAKKSLSEMS